MGGGGGGGGGTSCLVLVAGRGDAERLVRRRLDEKPPLRSGRSRVRTGDLQEKCIIIQLKKP